MKRRLVPMTAVALTLLVAGVLAQSGSELFSQALSKEKTEGKLNEAIALYQRIVSEFASDHALAAKALVQIGHAYEKLGKNEARQAYDRVVREYADQRELAAEAVTRLAVLDRELASVRPTAAASGLVARQVWTGPDVGPEGSMSADGKYLSFTDWTTGDLAVRDMATGEKRYLTRKGTWDESDEFAEWSVISPNSSQIAYSWSNKDFLYELRIIPRDGGQPRVVYRNDQIEWLLPCSWSPDGRTLAVELARRGRTTQLALISVADGSVRVLKSLDWRTPTTMEFSPDGRYLAYDFPPIESAPERDVFVIAVDGSRDSVVVSHPANDIVLGWFPTGQNLLFASDRTGTNSLWSIRVDNGRPQGEPHLLKEGIGVVIRSGFTRGGDLYYGLATGAVDVYTAKIDPVTGKAVSEPARLRARYEGGKLGGIWSADGSRLAYGVKSLVNLRAPATLSVQNVTPGQAQVPTWRVPLSYWNPNRLGWLNADSILMTGKDLNGRLGLFRFGLATGEIQPIVLGVLVRQHFVSEDGRTLFYERRSAAPGDSQPFSVRARDLVTGDERVVYPHGVQDLALSPDGESLAFVTGSRSEDPSAGTKPSIRIVSTRGGPTREIWTFDSRPVAPAKLIWTADGKAVLFPTTSGATDEIWRLSVQGGAPEKVGVSLSHITSLSLNPDGRQLAISAGASAFEIWVMENLGASLPTNR